LRAETSTLEGLIALLRYAIVEVTTPLIDDFEVARRAARAAIEAIAS
jgi:hypothetical protein